MEELRGTWDKRFKQRHYSYRDSHHYATTVLTELQSLALLAQLNPSVYYPFGTNARLINPMNWPASTDFINRGDGTILTRMQCYAREVMVYVTQDTWVRFISLNPVYLILLAQGYTATQIAAMGVTATLTEVEHFMAENEKDTFYPTYGVAIVFRADSMPGEIHISAEGNVEGSE